VHTNGIVTLSTFWSRLNRTINGNLRSFRVKKSTYSGCPAGKRLSEKPHKMKLLSTQSSDETRINQIKRRLPVARQYYKAK